MFLSSSLQDWYRLNFLTSLIKFFGVDSEHFFVSAKTSFTADIKMLAEIAGKIHASRLT